MAEESATTETSVQVEIWLSGVMKAPLRLKVDPKKITVEDLLRRAQERFGQGSALYAYDKAGSGTEDLLTEDNLVPILQRVPQDDKLTMHLWLTEDTNC